MLIKFLKKLTALTFIVIQASTLNLISPSNTSASPPKKLKAIFNVLDGGTLLLNGQPFKILNISVPHAKQKCKKGSLPWLCGAAAKKFLQQLVSEKTLKCALYESNNVQCFLNGRDLAVSLIRAGWAIPITKKKEYKNAEHKARNNKVGLWAHIKN